MGGWNGVKTAIMLFHSLSILASLARLIYRTRTRRLWWDDFWALVSMCCDLTMMVTFGIRYLSGYNPAMMNVLCAINIVAITSVLWGARLSIAVTIVRLVPPGPGRLVTKFAAALFALVWCGLVAQKLFVSQSFRVGQCKLPSSTGILELCTDLTADIWLICSPAYLLWNSKLTHRRQIVIYSVFASDILLTAASVAHCVYILKQSKPAMIWSGHFQVAISLIICNLLVLVTWLYSRIYPSDQEEESSHSINDSSGPPSRSRRRGAPVYGYDGSVLVLTEMSNPSISLASTISDNQSTHSAFGRSWSKRRTHSLNTLFPIIFMPRETLPSYLRPSQSCPALFDSAPDTLTIPEKVRNGCDDITLDNIQFGAQAVRRPPSVVLSFDSECWNVNAVTQAYGMKRKMDRALPLPDELIEKC